MAKITLPIRLQPVKSVLYRGVCKTSALVSGLLTKVSTNEDIFYKRFWSNDPWEHDSPEVGR